MPALKRVLSSYLSSSLQKFVPKIFSYRWVKYLSHCSNKSGNLYYYSYTSELQTRLFLFWIMSWLFLEFISISILYLLSNFILLLLLHLFTKVLKQEFKLLLDKYYICNFYFYYLETTNSVFPDLRFITVFRQNKSFYLFIEHEMLVFYTRSSFHLPNP